MMAVERDAAPNTLSAYGRDLADAEALLAVAGGLMRGVGARTSRPSSPTWRRRGLSPATAARRRSAVRQFYRFALGEGWRDRRSVPPRRCARSRAAPCPRC